MSEDEWHPMLDINLDEIPIHSPPVGSLVKMVVPGEADRFFIATAEITETSRGSFSMPVIPDPTNA